MKSINFLIALIFAITLQAKDVDIYDKVASLNKGLNGYIIGKELNENQKKVAKITAIKEAASGTYKFKDNDLYVITNKDNDKVLVLYKDYKDINATNIKNLISEYMYEFEEPTTITHNKIIYWIFNKDGRLLTQDDLLKFKDSLINKTSNNSIENILKKNDNKDNQFESFVMAKLSSDKDIIDKNVTNANAYFLISSEKILKTLSNKK